MVSPLIVFVLKSMVKDTISLEDMHYIKVISNMRHAVNGSTVAYKLMLQYKTSKMVFKTLFNLTT